VLKSWTGLVLALGCRSVPEDVTATRDIVYVSGSVNPKHRLDLYMPKDARDVPVVLFVHGGYWVGGDKEEPRYGRGLYGSIGIALAKRGIGCVVTNYRLSPETDIEGMLDDVTAAFRWTRENVARHGGDPKRIFLMGHSAGGHLAALLGACEPVRGVIALSAIWDVADMEARQGNAFNRDVTYPVFGRDAARWKKFSPLERTSREGPPVLILVGSRDFAYLIPQAERARDRLGDRHKFRKLDGYDHFDMILRFGASEGDVISGAVTEFVRG
jgi:acetyl esterase/lipase